MALVSFGLFGWMVGWMDGRGQQQNESMQEAVAQRIRDDRQPGEENFVLRTAKYGFHAVQDAREAHAGKRVCVCVCARDTCTSRCIHLLIFADSLYFLQILSLRQSVLGIVPTTSSASDGPDISLSHICLPLCPTASTSFSISLRKPGIVVEIAYICAELLAKR